MTTDTIINRLTELAEAADETEVGSKIAVLASKLRAKREQEKTSDLVEAARTVQSGDHTTHEWIEAAKLVCGGVERMAEITGRSIPSVYGWLNRTNRTIPAKAAEAIRAAFK